MPREILDVINPDDDVISQEPRSTVHRLGLLHRGVHVFLVTPARQLIVQRRSLHCESFTGALDCSLSEHVKSGESYLQAAQRGLEEELGFTMAQLQPLLKFRLTYAPNDHEISLLYEAIADINQVSFDPYEVDEIAAYCLGDIEKMIRDGSESFTPWFTHMLDWYNGKPSQLEVLQLYTPTLLLNM